LKNFETILLIQLPPSLGIANTPVVCLPISSATGDFALNNLRNAMLGSLNQGSAATAGGRADHRCPEHGGRSR
jgi:hypothetical protein